MSHVVRSSNASLGQLWQNQSKSREARGQATVTVETYREPPPVRYTPRPVPLPVAPIVIALRAEPIVIEHAPQPTEIEPGYAEVVARHHGEASAPESASPVRIVERPKAPSRVDNETPQLRSDLRWSARHADERREVDTREYRATRARATDGGHLVQRTTAKSIEQPRQQHFESVEHVTKPEPQSILRVRPKDRSEDRERHQTFVAAPAEAGREKGGLEAAGDHATPTTHKVDVEA